MPRESGHEVDPPPSDLEIDRSASQHGHDLLLQGFTVSQVVHDYGNVCQTITELAIETNAPISADDFRMLNRCLDEAIAGAVTKYSRESQNRASVTQSEATERSNERVGFLVHELRNLVNTAIVAFGVLKSHWRRFRPDVPSPVCGSALRTAACPRENESPPCWSRSL